MVIKFLKSLLINRAGNSPDIAYRSSLFAVAGVSVMSCFSLSCGVWTAWPFVSKMFRWGIKSGWPGTSTGFPKINKRIFTLSTWNKGERKRYSRGGSHFFHLMITLINFLQMPKVQKLEFWCFKMSATKWKFNPCEDAVENYSILSRLLKHQVGYVYDE